MIRALCNQVKILRWLFIASNSPHQFMQISSLQTFHPKNATFWYSRGLSLTQDKTQFVRLSTSVRNWLNLFMR